MTTKLSDSFIVGLIEADGGLAINISKRKNSKSLMHKAIFFLSQKDKKVCEAVQQSLNGVGTIIEQTRIDPRYNKEKTEYRLIVTNRNELLTVIIPLLKRFPFIGLKRIRTPILEYYLTNYVSSPGIKYSSSTIAEILTLSHAMREDSNINLLELLNSYGVNPIDNQSKTAIFLKDISSEMNQYLTTILPNIKLDKGFVSGFMQGDGTISVSLGKRIRFDFGPSDSNDLILIKLKEFWGVGSVSPKFKKVTPIQPIEQDSDIKTPVKAYQYNALISPNFIVETSEPFFKQYPWIGDKGENLLAIIKAAQLMFNKRSLTPEEKLKIYDLTFYSNDGGTYRKKQAKQQYDALKQEVNEKRKSEN